MKKYLLSLLTVMMLVLVSACGDSESVSEEKDDSTANDQEVEKEAEEKSLKIGKELEFDLFDFKVANADVDGDSIEMEFEWKNHTGKSDKMSMLEHGSIEVYQDGEVIDPEDNFVADPDSHYHYKMPSTATGNQKATYEISGNEPIEVMVIPNTEEDSKVIEIEVE